jgi:hypothetical protein
MEPILDFVAELAVWGAFALLVWGAMLTLQQVFGSERKREAPRRAAEPAGRERHSGELALAVVAAVLALLAHDVTARMDSPPAGAYASAGPITD